jgi:hypothetical protein
MKIGISSGEAFPIYEFNPVGDPYPTIEVPDETLKKWYNAFLAFERAQEEIVAELEKQGHEDQVWANGCWKSNKIYTKSDTSL